MKTNHEKCRQTSVKAAFLYLTDDRSSITGQIMVDQIIQFFTLAFDTETGLTNAVVKRLAWKKDWHVHERTTFGDFRTMFI